MPEYVIRRGDTFYRLAQNMGVTCEDFLLCNPGLNPNSLQIGQKIVLPPFLNPKGKEHFAEVSTEQGVEYTGDRWDDVEMEIEGVRFRIKRLGESKVPHEIQLIVPRTEIRKIQPQGEKGPCEVQIMLSNVNIIHSPRLLSGKSDLGNQKKVEEQTPQSLQKAQPEAANNPLERGIEIKYDSR